MSAEVWGPLDENQYVVDFVAAGNAIKAIVAELDHRMLVPANHPAIRVLSHSGETEVAFAGRRWIFPHDDCLLLPLAGTTTELLAQYVGQRLWAALTALAGRPPDRIRVEIGEGTGASAGCELP